MPLTPSELDLRQIRRDAAARAIVLSWRRLTSPGPNPTGGRARAGPGGKTLVACSGGADSSALLLALASAAKPGQLLAAHIVHDMRPEDEALADRDAAADLAAAVGIPFHEARVSVRSGKGNLEARARRERYRALAALAAEHGAGFIATAHHAADQMESVLMALLRGSGPRGLAGIARSRRVPAAPELRLVRPMLAVPRADAEHLCSLAGWAWREDATNLDTTRLRSALRHGPAKDFAALRPGSETRIARSAALMRDVAGLVRDRARAVVAVSASERGRWLEWPRGTLRQERTVVVGEALRAGATRLLKEAGPAVRGAKPSRARDRLTGKLLEPAVEAVRDRSTTPRTFVWPRLELRVASRTVTLAVTDEHG